MKANHPSHGLNLENYTARMVAICLLAILLLLALTGCRNGTAATTASSDVTGVYTLVSVDDKALPCVLNHAGTTMTIQSGSFTITPEGRCISSIKLSVGSNKDMTKVTRATYIQSGAELTMQWEHAGTTRGRVVDNIFTMNNEGMIFIYRK